MYIYMNVYIYIGVERIYIYTGNKSGFKSHYVPHLQGLFPHVL